MKRYTPPSPEQMVANGRVMSRVFWSVVTAITLLLVLVLSARAAGTLVNAGFEDGAAGWNISGGGAAGVYAFIPHSGTANLWLDGHGFTSSACQTVTVDAGDVLSVWYQHYTDYGDPVGSLSATVDGTTIGSVSGGSSGVWYQGVFTSTVAGAGFCLTGRAFIVDDITLEAGTPGDTPTPTATATATPTETTVGPTLTPTSTATPTETTVGPTATATLTPVPGMTSTPGPTATLGPVTYSTAPLSGGTLLIERRVTFGDLFVGCSALLASVVIAANALPDLGARIFKR